MGVNDDLPSYIWATVCSSELTLLYENYFHWLYPIRDKPRKSISMQANFEEGTNTFHPSHSDMLFTVS